MRLTRRGIALPTAMLTRAVLLVMLPEVTSTRFIVGSNMGWTSNVNYTVWARDKHFYVGDLLDLVHDRNQMNVLEVNKTDYEACNSDHPVHDWSTRTGRDVVPLNSDHPILGVVPS
ncbi:hypothetical protein RJ640_025638 [Escallonia rubra]|uniref:Phytocyanin domain-containing protein n=1 Tax=Escallonia rubra TaxID=112253 RepID=A0AA88UMT6_9ASTE|nr:hypothetical protein RJ640_025638 [Escallonia rubra]